MSTPTNDPWETEMSRTFDQRVRDLNEAPLSLDQVKGKAVRIRRNRRIGTAAAGLAAAAVIIPVAVFAGGALTDSDSSPDITPKPKETVIDPEGIGFGYIEERLLHRADGTATDVFADYGWATQIGDTVFAVRNDDETGNLTLDVLEDSGTPTESVDLSSHPVVSDDGTVLAYVEADGDLVTRGEDAGSATSTDIPDDAYPIAVTDDSVFLNDGMGVNPPLAIDPVTGVSEVAVPGAIGVHDADASGRLAVQTGSSDEGSCGGVYDRTTSEYLWKTCKFYLFGLSPGGKYVEATHAYLDGFGHAYTAILDATTGKELYRFDPPAPGAFTVSSWQDSEHLLVSSYEYEASEWTVYRIAADGTHEAVLGPKKASDFEPPFTVFDGH